MINVINKNKKAIVIVLMAIIFITLFCDGRSAKDTAQRFVVATLKGDAKIVANLTSDITIEESNYTTRKLYTHALEENLKKTTERYKDKYGDSWKYKVKVIDTYDVDFSEIEDFVEITDYISSNMKDVAISIEHKGSGWFNDKEGTEDIVITCIKQGRKWYVLYWEQLK